MINLDINGEVCLNSNWDNPGVLAVLKKLSTIKFKNGNEIDFHFFEYVLTVKGQGCTSDIEVLKGVINELNEYLTPNSIITLTGSGREITVRLSRNRIVNKASLALSYAS